MFWLNRSIKTVWKQTKKDQLMFKVIKRRSEQKSLVVRTRAD